MNSSAVYIVCQDLWFSFSVWVRGKSQTLLWIGETGEKKRLGDCFNARNDIKMDLVAIRSGGDSIFIWLLLRYSNLFMFIFLFINVYLFQLPSVGLFNDSVLRYLRSRMILWSVNNKKRESVWKDEIVTYCEVLSMNLPLCIHEQGKPQWQFNISL